MNNMSPNDKSPSRLEKDAEGNSVTERKLMGNTNTSYVYHNRVIDYLNKNEQPHYFLFTGGFSIMYDGTKTRGTFTYNSLVITDQRILLISASTSLLGGSKDDSAWELSYSDIKKVGCSKGLLRHLLIVTTTDHEYKVKILGVLLRPFGYNYSEIQEAKSYVRNKIRSNKQNVENRTKSNIKIKEPFTDLVSVSPHQPNEGSKSGSTLKHSSVDSKEMKLESTPEDTPIDSEKTDENIQKPVDGDRISASLLADDEREKNQKSQRKEKKEELQGEIKSIRSDLDKIDSLIVNVEYHQAEKTVDELKSDISSLKQRVSRRNFDILEAKLRRLERKCNKKLSKSHILTQLRGMDPYEFEAFVAKLWEKQGWDAQVTSASSDKGIDVIAMKEDLFEERRHLIQVKRHGKSSSVGSEDIQRYASLYQRNEQVDNVFVVTSNQFTSEAEEVAKERDVSTANCDELYQMITET